MTTEQEALIRKAHKSLQAAKLLLSNAMPDFAASRAYYTMFYIASALLLGKGLSFSKHGSLIAAFGLHFVKTGEIDAKFHRRLIDAQDNRVIGDYSSTSSLTETETSVIISQAEEFLFLAEQMLGAASPFTDLHEAGGSTEPT
jgi:uncharacterized protein (UPF0332 family)